MRHRPSATMMHSNQRSLLLISAVVFSLLVGFLVMFPRITKSNYDAAAAAAAQNLMNPTVNLYGEALCPDTVHAIVDIIKPMFANGMHRLMKLRYIAYGNVRGDREAGEEIHCQHGTAECKYNRYLNCAQKLVEYDQNRWFPYVECMAEQWQNLDKKADLCAETLTDSGGVKAEDIVECAEGEEGDELELEAAKETAALIPGHTFVPWITGNGVALGGAFEDLERYICVAAPVEARYVQWYDIFEC